MLLNKRYSIRCKKRFTSFLVVSTVILGALFYSLSSLTVTASSYVEADMIRSLSEEEVLFLEGFEEVEVFIRSGDSSWDIQQKLAPNHDVRQILYYGGIINGRSMGEVKAGENIVFLKEIK